MRLIRAVISEVARVQILNALSASSLLGGALVRSFSVNNSQRKPGLQIRGSFKSFDGKNKEVDRPQFCVEYIASGGSLISKVITNGMRLLFWFHRRAARSMQVIVVNSSKAEHL